MADINIIIQPDGFIEALKYSEKIKDNLSSIGTKEGAESVKLLSAEVKKLKEELDALAKSKKIDADATSKQNIQQKTFSELTSQIEKEEAKLRVSMSDRVKKLEELRAATAKQNQLNKETLKIEQSEIGSLDRLRAELTKLTRERNALSDALGKNKGKFQELTQKINENNKAQDVLSDKMLLQKRNIGNYQSALDGLRDKFSSIPGPIGDATTKIGSFATALGKFGPIGALIGGAILALSAPFAAFFTSTERGMDMMREKVGGFKAAIQALRGEIIKLGDALVPEDIKAIQWGDILIGDFANVSGKLGDYLRKLKDKMNLAGEAGEKLAKEFEAIEDAERAMLVPKAEAQDAITASLAAAFEEGKSREFKIAAMEKAQRIEKETTDSTVALQQRKTAAIRKLIELEFKNKGEISDASDQLLQDSLVKEKELRSESNKMRLRNQKTLNMSLMDLHKEMEAMLKKIEDGKKQELKDLATLRVLQSKDDTAALKNALKVNLDIELENAELTNTQKLILKEKYNQDVAKLDEEAFKKSKEIEDILLDFQKETDKTFSDLADESREDQDDKTIAATERRTKAEDEKERAKQAAISAGFETSRMFIDLLSARSEAAMEKELSQVGLTEAQKDQIRIKYARKQQAMAVAMTIVNTAQSIQKTFGEYGFTPWGIIAAALAAISGGIQIGIIKAQKFAKGGEIGGLSHSEGGTVIEAERGEFVVKKSAYQKNKNLVNAINAEDSYKIAIAMRQDKRIESESVNYNKKIYELLSEQEIYGETNDHYVIQKGNTKFLVKKK